MVRAFDMKCPKSLNEQPMAHCRGEILRGSGIWPHAGLGLSLEPPFEPFDRTAFSRWDLLVNSLDAPFQGYFVDQLKRLFFLRRRHRRAFTTAIVSKNGTACRN
jgi:hypothetical protein